MTEADCLEALRRFSGRVERMLTGSHGIDPGTFAPDDQVTVAFLCAAVSVLVTICLRPSVSWAVTSYPQNHNRSI